MCVCVCVVMEGGGGLWVDCIKDRRRHAKDFLQTDVIGSKMSDMSTNEVTDVAGAP